MTDGGATEIDPVRRGFGLRLQAARKNAKRRDGFTGYTQEEVALRFNVNKATVSAWETGRGAPDAFVLRELAKLYGVSADAILWEDSLSPEAMQIAAEFDHLQDSQRRAWRLLWLGFITSAAEGGEQLPPAPTTPARGPMGLVPQEEDIGDELPETNLTPRKFPTRRSGKRSA